MKIFLAIFGLIASILLLFMLLLLYVVITSPTCTERGGVEVSDGVQIQNVMIGKVMIPQLTPKYKCVISSK